MFQGDCAIYDGMYGMVRQLGVVLRENGLDSLGLAAQSRSIPLEETG